MAFGNHYNLAIMDLLANLNTRQQQAVTAGNGPILVLSGPGSGKTRVLTLRIAYLIQEHGVFPYNILAVTFTNKAAREMGGRVDDLLMGNTRGLTLGTFHGTCARILRQEAEHLPIANNFVIFDDDDQHTLVKQAIKDLNLDEKTYRAQGVHAAISNAKNELLQPDDFPVQTYRDEVTKRVYNRYQALLQASNAVDFDDLLLYTAKLLEEFPAVRERYARRYEHVLVDEFQDTNMAQYQIVNHLASFHRNIFVVGDPDQSIYRWRGADYRNVLRFERDYPDAQVILLEQNYRSTQNILDAAMGVIDQNPQRTKKHLFSDRGEGQKIVLHETYSDQEEALFVIETIARLVKEKKNQPGDFAVMYRTNAQSRLLEEAFVRANLPYRIVGAQRFYGRREVKDIISYLRLANNPDDEVSLLRVINLPARGIGAKTLSNLRVAAKKAELSPGKLLMRWWREPELAESSGMTARALRPLMEFGSFLAGWAAAAQSDPPLLLLDQIVEETGYRQYIDDGTEEGRDRWENVLELRRLAADRNDRSLILFLEDIALVSDQDTLVVGSNAPTLLTLHAAKGLEFPVVFITGLNEKVLPHNRSYEDVEEMMEERRLFYVGITRAKDRLYLSYAQVRNVFGFTEFAEPSQFLYDVPEEKIQKSGSLAQMPGYSSQASSRKEKLERWESTPPPVPAKIIQPTYRPGMRVQHSSFGEGLVLNTQIQDQDEIVDVFFEKDIGLKRVVASLAHLQVVKK